MHFRYGCVWDKGDFYKVNQDSFGLQLLYTGSGPCAMAVVCDGVGSLYKGEVASGYTVRTMTAWFYEMALPILCGNASATHLKRSCIRALKEVHEYLQREGEGRGQPMATTFTMCILFRGKYHVFHVGDCACFKIGRRIVALTKKQTNADGELLGALGVGQLPKLVIKCGRCWKKSRFLLCSDGFARCLSGQGLQGLGNEKKTYTNDSMERLMKEMLERGRRKGEKDNCTGIVLGRIH